MNPNVIHVVITYAIRGTSRECLCKELRLDALSVRTWYQRLFFNKIVKGVTPVYLKPCLNLINERNYETR